MRSIKRAETLKSGRRAVLNATIKIVGRCLNASCYFVGRFFNQYKCDFKKRAEILKNVSKVAFDKISMIKLSQEMRKEEIL